MSGRSWPMWPKRRESDLSSCVRGATLIDDCLATPAGMP